MVGKRVKPPIWTAIFFINSPNIEKYLKTFKSCIAIENKIQAPIIKLVITKETKYTKRYHIKLGYQRF